MTTLMGREINFKFLIDEDLKAQYDKILEDQGTSLTTGTTRLIQFFISVRPEIQAIILRQVRGRAASEISRFLLESIVSSDVSEELPRRTPKVKTIKGGVVKDG